MSQPYQQRPPEQTMKLYKDGWIVKDPTAKAEGLRRSTEQAAGNEQG
jgi:hypothetical protein